MTKQEEREAIRAQLIAACMKRAIIGVTFEDQKGVRCALVGRPVIVRAEHVVFSLGRGSEQALPIEAVLVIDMGEGGSEAA